MKIQARIMWFSVVILAAIMGFTYILLKIDYHRIEIISKEKVKDKKILFEEIISAKGDPVKTLVFDYSIWDEMVDYVKNPRKQWVEINLFTSLKTFKANALWVYTPAYDLVCFVHDGKIKNATGSLPINFELLFRDGYFKHFFLRTPETIYEIWTAPIQPSDDTLRISTPRGILLTAKRWDKEYISEIARMAQCQIMVLDDTIRNRRELNRSFYYTLTDYNREDVFFLEVFIDSQFLEWLQSSSLYILSGILIFSICLVLIIYSMAKIYLGRPFKIINMALEKDQPVLLNQIGKRTFEFSRLKHLIIEFYYQKQNIENEISIRNETENQLKKSEFKYHSLFNAIDDAIFLIDGDSLAFIEVNRAAEAIYEFSSKEFLLLKAGDLCAEGIDLSALGKTQSLHFPMQYHRRKSGSLFPCELKFSLLQIQTKVYILGSARDISSQIESEKARRANEYKLKETLSSAIELNKLLLDSETRLKALLDNSIQSFFWIGPDKKIKAFNKAAAQTIKNLVGIELLQNQNMLAYLQDIDEFNQCLANSLNGKVSRVEKKLVSGKDKLEYWFELDYIPITDNDNKITGILLAMNDITDRKIAQNAIQRSERRLKEAEKIARLGHFEVVPAQNKFYWSEETIKILETNKLSGLLSLDDFRTIVHPEDLEFVVYNFERCQRERKIFDLNFRIVTPTEQVKHVQCKATFEQDSLDMVIFGTMQDISQQILVENALTESREKYRKVLNTMEEGVGIIDSDLNIQFANKAACIVFGCPEGLVGRNISEFISFEALRKVKEESVIRQQGTTGAYELEIVRSDNSKRLIFVRATPQLEKGQYLGSFVVFSDITEEKRAEEKMGNYVESLKELNATKDKFFSIIAHDLKNPFNTISGFSQLLMNNLNVYDKEKIGHFIEIIYNSSMGASALLENLLQWALSQSGKMNVVKQNFSLSSLAQGMVLLYKEQAQNKNIRLHFEISGSCFCLADKDMINVVARNLVSNAIKFSEPGSEVKIKTRTNDTFAIMEVVDQGFGIAAEDIEKLFKVDIHYSTVGTSGEKGSGLGLILCKEFVEKNDGRIWVNSDPGKGSVFGFSLPIR